MKKLISILLTGVAALGLASRASAQISLSLQPSPQTINVGDPAMIDLFVSGLGNLSTPSLGAFDFDLSYNATILSAVSISFGNFLDLGTLGSIKFFDLSTPGAIRLNEVSFESVSALNTAQSGSFKLATLGFTGLAAGISSIDFVLSSLSNEQGQSLTVSSTTSGSIGVTGPVVVPDVGSTAPLLLLAIAGLTALRRYP